MLLRLVCRMNEPSSSVHARLIWVLEAVRMISLLSTQSRWILDAQSFPAILLRMLSAIHRNAGVVFEQLHTVIGRPITPSALLANEIGANAAGTAANTGRIQALQVTRISPPGHAFITKPSRKGFKRLISA